MFSFRTNPSFLFLFLLCFLIFSTFLTSSHGAPPFDNQQDLKVPPEYEKQLHDANLWGNNHTATTSYNSTGPPLILAANRTYRKDPTDNFKYYTGGWNITNEHYLYSLAFSAIGPFLTAAIWFILFGLCLLCICCRRCCCCVKKEYGYSKVAYAISLILLILLTLAAITGTAFLYTGQGRFHSSLVDTINYILKEANQVILRLRNLYDTLLIAKDLAIAKTAMPEDMRGEIDKMKVEMDATMVNIQEVTAKSSHDIRSFLVPLRSALLYLAAILLILAVLGFLFSILGASCLVYSLVIIGWILVVGTLILSGMFLLVSNAVSDTCVAMDEWLQNPDTSSALEQLIPRVDPATAQQISTVTKDITFGTVNVVNVFISNVANVNLPPEAGPLYYNQSGPLMPTLCSPYSTNLTNRQCAVGEVTLDNASQAYQPYVCNVSDSGICTTPGRLTPKIYDELNKTAKVSYGLYSEMPFVIELIDSTFLKRTFAYISKNNCPNLRKYTEWMYLGFLTSSIAVMLSLMLWMIYARERRHRAYTKKIDSSRNYGLESGAYK